EDYTGVNQISIRAALKLVENLRRPGAIGLRRQLENGTAALLRPAGDDASLLRCAVQIAGTVENHSSPEMRSLVWLGTVQDFRSAAAPGWDHKEEGNANDSTNQSERS